MLFQQLPFAPAHPPDKMQQSQDIPQSMDVYFRDESFFIPAGKKISDLTSEELAEMRARYRFDPYRPACYQGITGFGVMIN